MFKRLFKSLSSIGIISIVILMLTSCGLNSVYETDYSVKSEPNTRATMPFLKADGTDIVDTSGNKFSMVGINLGNWLLWEGYLMMGDFNYRTHSQFLDSVQEAFGGDLTKALEFEHQWRLNYVTEKEIADLAGLGYNSVRVPFSYKLFWDKDTSTVSNFGFQYIDTLITECEKYNIYILLDMHAAPGYQNPGDHSDNNDSNASQPRDTVKFWDDNNVEIASTVWRHIANYYKDEPTIWGYDLINEPVPQDGREYELLPSLITMRDAIREVDNNHIIVAEGSWWGSDMQKLDWMDSEVQSQTGVTDRWDDNLVYQTHHYSDDTSQLDSRLTITDKLNVPLILGEYGETENSYIRNHTDWCLANDVGFYPWSFKKMSHDRTLWTIYPNSAYDELKDFINNGGTPRADLYSDIIDFCQNNITNGASGIEWHQDFYEAVKGNDPVIADYIEIPGIVEAENYSDMYGIQVEDCSAGGENIGWTDSGDWLEYDIDVQQGGAYDVELYYAGNGGRLKIYVDEKIKSTVNLSSTGGWQDWSTIVKSIDLDAGIQKLKIAVTSSGFNLDKMVFAFLDSDTTAPTVPGSLTTESTTESIDISWSAATDDTAVDYYEVQLDDGVINVTNNLHYQFTGLNASTTYSVAVRAVDTSGNRSDFSSQAVTTLDDTSLSVDILLEAENYNNMSGISVEDCSEGGQNVGWIDSGDWFDFNIDIPETGVYQIEYRIASANGGGHFRLDTDGGSTVLDEVYVSSTGGWQNWETISSSVELNAGSYTIGIYAYSGGFNMNYLKITN